MTARLIRDEPRWPMPSLTSEPSYRRLRVWQLDEGGLVAVITERGEGTSVTNVAERAYAAVRREHPGARVFEHYPPDVGAIEAEHVDEIVLNAYGHPRWSYWPMTRFVTWLGLGPDVLGEAPA